MGLSQKLYFGREIRDSEVIFSRNDLKFTKYIVQIQFQIFKYTQVIAFAWWLHIETFSS